jgi:hypothetical protein
MTTRNEIAMTNQWVVVSEYACLVEAQLDIGILENNDIPCRVEGPPVGVFGPGYSGATAAGVRIMVPFDRAEEATELLVSTPD